MGIPILAVPTLAVDSAAEGVELLVLCKDESVESTAGNFLNPLVREGCYPLRALLELGVTVSALAFVVLGCLTSTPCVEVSLFVNSRAVVVPARDLFDGSALKALDFAGNVQIGRKIRLVLQVGATELEYLSVIKEDQSKIIAAADLGHPPAL
jgi:hypothetical protein